MPPKTRASSIRDASKAKADEEEAQEAVRATKLAKMVAEKKAKALEKKTQESDKAAQEAAALVKQTLALSAPGTTAAIPSTTTASPATGNTLFPFHHHFIFFFILEFKRNSALGH